MAKKKAETAGRHRQKRDAYSCAARCSLLLSLIGALVSSYTFLLQYSMSGKSVCANCLEMLKSRYAIFLGIPISIICLVGFVLLFLVTLGILSGHYRKENRRIMDEKQAVWLCIILSVIGFGLAVYYTQIQGWVLGVWCIMCVVLSILVTALLALYLMMKFREK